MLKRRPRCSYLFLWIFLSSLNYAQPAPELATLRDIHLPTAIAWWPLAPGWYALALLLLAILTVIVFFIRRHYLYGRAKRQALTLLIKYQQQHQRDVNTQQTSARLSELLKRVALVYFPRLQVASLQGEAWLAFLNDSSKGLDFNKVRSELLELPYQLNSANDNLDLLFSMVKAWISQRGKPCSS